MHDIAAASSVRIDLFHGTVAEGFVESFNTDAKSRVRILLRLGIAGDSALAEHYDFVWCVLKSSEAELDRKVDAARDAGSATPRRVRIARKQNVGHVVSSAHALQEKWGSPDPVGVEEMCTIDHIAAPRAPHANLCSLLQHNVDFMFFGLMYYITLFPPGLSSNWDASHICYP